MRREGLQLTGMSLDDWLKLLGLAGILGLLRVVFDAGAWKKEHDTTQHRLDCHDKDVKELHERIDEILFIMLNEDYKGLERRAAMQRLLKAKRELEDGKVDRGTS